MCQERDQPVCGTCSGIMNANVDWSLHLRRATHECAFHALLQAAVAGKAHCNLCAADVVNRACVGQIVRSSRLIRCRGGNGTDYGLNERAHALSQGRQA